MTEAIPGATLLAIETTGSACSAAVTRGGTVLAAERVAMRHGHGEALLPMIDRVMRAAGCAPAQLDFVAAATGPGGFTGIRVGLAAAQGIALATAAHLIGVTSFAAVAAAVAATASDCGRRLLVALDSRREDLYVQLFAGDNSSPLSAPAAVLPEQLADYVAAPGLARDAPLLIAGDAAPAAAAALRRRNDVAIGAEPAPDALGVAVAALRLLRAGAAVDPARPLYLRPPDVTLPRGRPVPATTPVRARIATLPPGMALPLAVLHGACFPEDPWDAPAFERILALFGVFGYLAVDPAEPAGFILARDLGGEAEILTLGVLPALRRHGAARALLDRVLDEARRRGLGSVVLEVAADNDAARRLYAAAGFLRVGQRPRYYCRRGGTVDGLILRRGITSEAASP